MASSNGEHLANLPSAEKKYFMAYFTTYKKEKGKEIEDKLHIYGGFITMYHFKIHD
jgi:hypothetical protein